MPDFPADWSPPDRDSRPLTHNDLDQIDRYMGGGRVSEAQGDDEIRVFDLTAEIRRLRGANVDVYRLSELHGIVSSALNLLHEDLVDDGDRAEAWETAAEALTTELEPFLTGQPTGEPTEADPREAQRAFQISTLRHLLEAASMRNWEVRSGSSWEVTSPGYGQRADVVASFPYKGDERAVSDARLVAAMRNALPDLLDEIDRLRALVGGRPAAPTLDDEHGFEMDDAGLVYTHTDGTACVIEVTCPAARESLSALLSRSAAEPPEEHDDGA